MSKTYLLLTFLILFQNHSIAQNVKTYQAEDAFFFKAKVETEHSGFSGTGYVNFDNEPGGYIEFTVFMAETDSQIFSVRYANGSTNTRSMELKIDSAIVVASLNFQPTGAWTNWGVDSVKVYLKQGANKIRLTSITADGGPNIDRIDVTGTPGVILYELSLEVIGNGRIELNPPGEWFEAGANVEIHAIADVDWQFLEWWGDATGIENPLSIIMNSNKSISAVFTTKEDSAYQFENSPIGFASVDALGQNGTIGGQGGDTIIVKTGEELVQILDARRDPRFDKNNPALVILVEGKLTWNTKEMMDVKETYDLSILGKGTDAQIEGFGLNVFRSHNIIIRNIEFRDAPDDAINVTNELSHHIWIDHCTLSDDPASDPAGNNHDGLLDIKDGASFVTVSWNHFRNHHKTCLLGHSDDNGATDVGRLKTTYHHNWFDNTNSRHPRARFGEVHVFNNYYDNSAKGMSYGVASTMEADVVVESNYFKDVPHPTYVGYGDSGPGDLIEKNNIYENSGAPETRGTSFDPETYYTYQPDNPLHLPDLLMRYSGSGKLYDAPSKIQQNAPEFHPVNFILLQNFPNPFNSTTVVRYQISEAGMVVLKVYDVLSREVAQLVNGEKPAGEYSVEFNAKNLPSGLYLYQIAVGTNFLTRKMLLLK